MAGRRDRGFALLIVLWAVVLLALLATNLASNGRIEAKLAANLRDAAVTQAAADGAVFRAASRVLLGEQAWSPGGEDRVALNGVSVAVRIHNLAGRVNPNIAPPELLRPLLVALEVTPERAVALVAAIQDWISPGRTARPYGAKAAEYRAAGRDYGPPNAPFRSLDELGDVLGMTPALLARLEPHLTLWWSQEPELAAADPVVARALRAIGAVPIPPPNDVPPIRVLDIEAAAAGPGGARFVRHAVIALVHPTGGASTWRVLQWDTAGSPTAAPAGPA